MDHDETEQTTPGPADHQEASAAWLEEAEAMRAAQGTYVTLDQALAFSIAYGLQALLGVPPIDPFGGCVDPSTIEG